MTINHDEEILDIHNRQEKLSNMQTDVYISSVIAHLFHLQFA